MDESTTTLTIDEVDDIGQGISYIDNEKIFVPYALAGEILEGNLYFRPGGKERALKISKVISPSKDRTDPFCKYFGECGGCKLQHMKEDAYKEFKHALLNKTLAQYNISQEFSFIFWGQQKQRRRVSLSYFRSKEGLRLGFYKFKSHIVHKVDLCPLLLEEINAIIPGISETIHKCNIKDRQGFVHITLADDMIDVSWSPSKFRSSDLQEEIINNWKNFAEKYSITRVTRAGKEIIYESRTPTITWNNTTIPLPSGAFLQPSDSSEKAMVEQVKSWIDLIKNKPDRVVDLFCGLGTFSFPFISQDIDILSYDCDGPSISELEKISKDFEERWKVYRQDLFTTPVGSSEFHENDVVIIDPPRAGAEAQVKELANSKVKNIIMISCNPHTFARDLSILVEGGFEIKEIVALDQFPMTPHVEAMAWMER